MRFAREFAVYYHFSTHSSLCIWIFMCEVFGGHVELNMDIVLDHGNGNGNDLLGVLEGG
jgi:hypothetical protein